MISLILMDHDPASQVCSSRHSRSFFFSRADDLVFCYHTRTEEVLLRQDSNEALILGGSTLRGTTQSLLIGRVDAQIPPSRARFRTHGR